MQPVLGPRYNVVEGFCTGIAFQFGFTLAFLHPQDGIIGIRIDHRVFSALLLQPCQGVHYGEKLADVVGAMERSVVKHPLTSGKVNALVFHRSGISTAGSIHSHSVCPHLWRQGQHGIVAPRGRIHQLVHHYILSGTSIPKRLMPFFNSFATLAAKSRRTARFSLFSSFRML